MKYYVAMILFALQLSVVSVEAVNIGTDPVGNARMGGQQETEEHQETHKQQEHKI